MLFTNLAPNTQFLDAIKAVFLILTPWRFKKGGASLKVEKMFSEMLPGHTAFTFESGRTSLHAILTAMDIRNGDEVLLQAYTCVAVPEPILWVGATPVFVDCDETLTMSIPDLEKKITPKTKAIIIQHTLGMPANLDLIMQIAKSKELMVIEDCAHALGARYNNQIVGTFGDASFFSFGRDKVVSSVFGGVAVTKNKILADAISKIQSEYPTPSYGWIFQQLLHPPIMWLGKKTYRFGGILLIGIAKTFGITSKAVQSQEKQGIRPTFALKRMPNALALLALRQLKKLECFNSHRQSLAKLYQELLSPLQISSQLSSLTSRDLPINRLTDQPINQSIHLRYTIWTDKREEIYTACKKEGILLGDWYDTVIAPRGVNYEKINYHQGSCPNAERIAKGTLNLPTDIHTSASDVKKIVKIIESVLKK
jgi:dTDP-4-amino-4,6-dideoxygalactose transaminase